MTGRLIKICPACGHINDLAEIFCTGIQEDGTTCSYNLLDVEATQERRPPVASDSPPLVTDVSDRPPQPSAESLDSNGFSRVCLNGHSLADGDLLCLTCGAVPASQVVSETFASEPEPAAESWQGETLADLPEAQRRDPTLLRALLGELDALLYRLQLEGGTHGDLQPDQVRLLSRQPLRLELGASAGQSSSSPSGDLTINPTSAVGLYSAPERLVGIQAPNSDWWSLGLLILEWLVGPTFWQGVHQQAWQLRVITDGVTIPDTVTDPWRSLLMGLLTRDPNDRWGHSEVIRWLDGDEEIPLLVEEPQVGDEGSIIRLAGQRYRSPDRYALAAAQAEVWDEALAQLQQGELLTWLEQNNLPVDSLAEVKRLAADESLDQDERLMLVLLLLNLNLPLCLRGEVIGAGNLAADPQRARAWLSGVLPGRLRRIGRHTWLADLADRREAALEQARTLRLNLAEARFDAAALIGDRRRLEQAWAERRQEWPAALHNGLSNLISRSRQSEEQLLLLVSAELEQFRSAADVLKEAERLAKQSKVAGHWDQAAARRWLANSQRDIFRALQEHVADFVRCGQRQPDDWADQFRSDQNLPLPQALVLLSIPLECWVRPEGGEHWQRLLYFFRRRVLSGIQRGPLLALSVTATGKRIDLAELTSQALPANTLVDHLVSRQARARSLDPDLLDANPQLSQRLRRLRQEADAYQRETGIAALYLGYPLLVKRDQAPNTGTPRKPKLIPLLLWPVRLSITGQGNLPQLGYDRDHGSGDGIRLNPAVGGVLSHRQNQSLQEALKELHQRSSLTGAQVMDVLSTVFSGSEGILERCPQKPSLPTGSDEYLLPSGVLFLCSFSAQTLAHELEQLERRPSLEGPMAALLRLTPDSPFPAKAPCAPAEHERFLVTPADPSQKRAVWASRQEPGVLIQGPPGTGKSQTIVNIVADAIGRHERVLVVCQKQAALEVVRNRLEAAQLGDRLCLITDPSSDRRSLLKKLREDLEVWDPNHRRDEFARERQAIATDVARLESELDGLYQAMATPLANSGLNDQEVIDGLLQLGINPNVPALTALRPLLQNCHVEEVRTIARQCADIASLWLRAQPEDSPLHVLRVFSTDESNLNSFSQAFKQFQELELARAKDFAEPSEVLESSDPKAMQCWIDGYASTLQVVDVNLAVLVTRWLPLFSDSTSRLIRERLEGLDQTRRLNKEPGVMVKWQALLTDLQDIAIENLLSAARQWSPKQAPLFSCLTREATNASIFDVFNHAFAKLLNIERIRVALHGSSKAVIEARETGVAQAWLDNGGSSIAPATDELASRFSRWIPLFDDSSGKLIREQLAVLGSERRLIGDTEIMMKWQALLTDLDGIAVKNLLYAARQWRSKQAFFFSSLTHEATNQTSIAVFSQIITGLLSCERARTNLFGLSENVLEVSEIGMAQMWLDNGGSRISEANDQLAARLSMWLPLFGDSSSKQIRERLEVLGTRRRIIQAPGSIVKWDALMADLKVLEMEDLHVATREWRKCREAFDPLFISHQQDLKRDTAPWTTLQALYGFEHQKSIIEPTILGATEATYLSGVVAWLEENESVIGGADIATAPLLAPCLKLYDSDRWRLIRLSLNKSKSILESQKPGQVAFGWDFEARSLGDELLSRLLSATQIRKQWMRSPSRIFRPSYLRSKALLKSIFPESVNNKDENQIASLEQLLEHEILLRNECREYEQILRDLGLFKKISNLPQHELLSSVDALIQQLVSVETILDAVSRCPLRQEAEQAIRSGRRDQILGFLESLKREIKRQHYRHQSLQVLHELSAWCAPDWLSGLEQKIKRDQMIIPELEEIFASWTSIVDTEKIIVQYVSDFADGKDSNHIASLEQALEYEIQLRQDCRQYEQILRDLGLFEKVSNLPQHELLSNVDALIQQLDSVETILDAVSRCPLRQEAEQAIRSGQRDQILEFLESLKRGIKRQHHRQQSLQALHELSAWCRPDWQSGLEQKIKGDQPIISELEEIFAIWTSLVDAEKVILQHVPEFVVNKDPNQIGSLEQALEYEIQLRHDCRQYEQILRDLGLFEKVSNLPQHELLSNVDALIQQLDSVETILDAVSRCPLRQEAEQAIRSGQRDQILEFLESLKRGIKRQHHRQQSLQALHELSAWCRPDWQSGMEQKIKGDQPIISELEEIFAIWTSLVDAEKVILQHVPEFVVNKDPNQIGSLEQALEYEIQLRQDCRIFQNIRSDLGFSHNSTNLSQSDLLSGMHELLEQFDQVSSVVLAISECPLQIDASAVVRSGQPERISAFINSLHRGVRRQEHRHRSRLLLKDLSLWCERNWLETLEQRIDSGQQVGVELEPVAQGCHRLVDFQLYRGRAASLSANEQSVMRVLATERNHWQALAPEHLAETVRITVEREALLGWQAGAEALEPALLLTRQDVDRRIKRLAEQDAHLLDLNRRMTAIPAAPERVQPRPNWDDIVMLQGPRARKLREVVELGEERGLFEICPVWLANPETVSQIFPLRQGLFDLVIFDEASQLPVENALPAMYRANRIVISGDEKQLPPTRFFSSGFADESDEEFNPDADGDDPEIMAEAINATETRRQVKDCGDLLVLASAAGLTHVSLDIHYRSRFRPLIAHSNAAFYQNKLSVPVLHPAEEIRRTRPLQVEVINGTYANQSNRDEAVALIAFLEDLWCGPHAAEHGTLPTVGVVTFNKTQADLIEDLLDRYTQTNPQFQQILERERQRRFQGEDCGFFVKNLENVQGDERDWILFSTTFGRDESGRFMRRFGALGLKGGERRLNVATSRARDKVVIFSSMPIEEISDAHRQGKTPQRPRDFLQSYLLYASAISEGHLDEAESLLNRLHRPNSSRVAAGARHSQRYFVQCVAEFLRKKGFEVDVPAAGDAFAFDLALRNPATGLFALGIECDPPRHPDLAHARDREIWRPRVLESSLPNVHRVWSRLWLIEPAREQRRLSDAVRKALPSPSPAP